MKKLTKILALVLAMAMMLTIFAGCQKTEQAETPAATSGNSVNETKAPEAENKGGDKTLVVGTQNFDGKFSPFFSTNAYEQEIHDLVHLPLLGSDREGAMVLMGIEGEVRPYNGTDYTYDGIADCVITENDDGTVYYDVTMKEGVLFSDGHEMNIDDAIFSMYVYCDPTYDGAITLNSQPIEGLDAYLSGMDSRINLILAAGPDGYTETEFFTEDQYNAFWTAFWAAGEKFAQEIVDYLVAAGANAEGDSVAACAPNWGYELNEDATVADFFKAFVDAYGYDISDNGINIETAGSNLSDLIYAELGDAAAEYQQGVQTGESAASISGIQKTGEYSMRVVMTEISAPAIYQFNMAVCPMHYYGEESLYDYDNNSFGFNKGDLSHVKSVTTQPLGAGPYKFVSYENGQVTLEANELYFKGEPKTKYIVYKEGQEADKVPGVVTGTMDLTDPSYSSEVAKNIAEANGGDINGDVLTTNMVANLGYGYVGFNAKNVCIDNKSDSDASKNLRKAIATIISVYRDVAIDSYYGEFGNVINYPISDTSWAAPRVTDEGYKIAFSTDVNGDPIYTEGMTADEKYEAAKAAALGFFEAAGYTVADGKVTAAPAGGKMDVEVLVGGGGVGDHPVFMALTMAQAALKEIGFNLIVTDMSNFAEMTNAVNSGTADMFAMAWQATADPDMYQIYHSKGGSNEKSYWIKDAELDELIMMARQSTDQTYRKTLYKEALDIVADWAVEIPMYQRQNCIIFSTERINMDTVTPDITTFWSWRNDVEKLEMN